MTPNTMKCVIIKVSAVEAASLEAHYLRNRHKIDCPGTGVIRRGACFKDFCQKMNLVQL